MAATHVVVDGSNIATEGRSTPSLRQLDEAVRAFLKERPHDTCTVVVDATFEHRIERSEQQVYEDALAAGEMVAPPAGTIGRGDKFLLEIAHRTGATVFSNDSFQEFHAEYEWLFDEGRLIGGKPVPDVGWIFTPRTPVRGPRSRLATQSATKATKAAKAAKAAKKAAAQVVEKATRAATKAPAKARSRARSSEAPAKARSRARSSEAPAKARSRARSSEAPAKARSSEAPAKA
ncbi:MAG: NYN domain-containing protein, partial [Acidimicrobiales bacterium]